MTSKKKTSKSAASNYSSHASKLVGLPQINICVIGAGGSGSIMVTHLCRIAQAFTALGGSTIRISIIDHDKVSPANIGRQCFAEADIGSYKSVVLAQRARAFYGLPVEGHVSKLETPFQLSSHVIIGCVDNIPARRIMSKVEDRYWLDLGNTDSCGQVVLGGHGLPTVFDLLPEMKTMKDKNAGPSCSMAEALERQDLFINSTIANLAGHLLWTLLRKGVINYHGYFANLTTGHVRPIPCPTLN